MKNIIFFIIFLILCSFSNAESETPEIEEVSTDIAEVSAGITPDKPILYKLDTFFEKVQVALAFKTLTRLELRLKLADEKLAEIEAMYKEKKYIQVIMAHKQREDHLTDIVTNYNRDDIPESFRDKVKNEHSDEEVFTIMRMVTTAFENVGELKTKEIMNYDY